MTQTLYPLCRECFVGTWAAVYPSVLNRSSTFACSAATCSCCGETMYEGVRVDQLGRDQARAKYARCGPGALEGKRNIVGVDR